MLRLSIEDQQSFAVLPRTIYFLVRRLVPMRGLSELDSFGSLDTLIGTANQLFSSVYQGEEVCKYLTSQEAHLAPSDVKTLSTESQSKLLDELTNIFFEPLEYFVFAGKRREKFEISYANELHESVSLIYRDREKISSSLYLETHLSVIAIKGAGRMIELRRYKQAKEAFAEGINQLAAVILRHLFV